MRREELGKNINADEAAAMGAVYQAAALSKAFKVKPFLVRDATVYPIQVSSPSGAFTAFCQGRDCFCFWSMGHCEVVGDGERQSVDGEGYIEAIVDSFIDS